jgi:dolichol-phosphate mannosyltransferase
MIVFGGQIARKCPTCRAAKVPARRQPRTRRRPVAHDSFVDVTPQAEAGPDTDVAPRPVREPSRDPVLSVVVPVLGGLEQVAPGLRALEASLVTPHETLLVYDTGDPPTPLAVDIAGVRLLRSERGPGVLNALKAGIAAARGELILVTTADGSDDPHVVERMVRQAGLGADLVAASRYVPGGRDAGSPILRRVMGRAAGLAFHWIAGVPIHDPTSGFKLYSRDFLDSVTIDSESASELGLELSVKAAIAGWMMAEVPTGRARRAVGTTCAPLRIPLPVYVHWFRAAMLGRLRRSTNQR